MPNTAKSVVPHCGSRTTWRRMPAGPGGYAEDMSITPPPPSDQPEDFDRPVDLGDAPDQEGVSEADAAERLDRDPDEQENKEDLR